MKLKLKITLIMMMALFCVLPNKSISTVNAASTTNTILVHPTIWSIHGIYTKSSTGKTVYATNYSGVGEYAYCYGHVRSNISGQWAQYSSDYKLSKNDSRYTMSLTNTIDAGKSVSLRLIGADTQKTDDSNKVKFEY